MLTYCYLQKQYLTTVLKFEEGKNKEKMNGKKRISRGLSWSMDDDGLRFRSMAEWMRSRTHAGAFPLFLSLSSCTRGDIVRRPPSEWVEWALE